MASVQGAFAPFLSNDLNPFNNYVHSAGCSYLQIMVYNNGPSLKSVFVLLAITSVLKTSLTACFPAKFGCVSVKTNYELLSRSL